MLDGDHYRTAELVNQLMSNAQMKHNLDLIECLKPELLKHDGWYTWDYSGGLITGSGKSPYEAMMNFQKAFYGN